MKRIAFHTQVSKTRLIKTNEIDQVKGFNIKTLLPKGVTVTEHPTIKEDPSITYKT